MENYTQRIENYNKISKELNKLNDAELSNLLKSAKHNHDSRNVSTSILNVGDTRVFIKKISLADLEMENKMSTKNIFNLPMYYQYGVGSAGFGGWRELKAHEMTTEWVKSGECQNFPMMYSYRVLPCEKKELVYSEDEKKEFSKHIESWNNSAEIRKSLEERTNTSNEVVIFMECFSNDLNSYLDAEFKKGNEAMKDAVQMVERDASSMHNFLKTKGFVHFDAHHGNYITDGKALYLTDFGLSLSREFELSDQEKEFLEKHRSYDFCMTMRCALGKMAWQFRDMDKSDAENMKIHPRELISKLLQDHDEGRSQIDPFFIDTFRKYIDMATALDDFITDFCADYSKSIKYQGEKLDGLCDKVLSSRISEVIAEHSYPGSNRQNLCDRRSTLNDYDIAISSNSGSPGAGWCGSEGDKREVNPTDFQLDDYDKSSRDKNPASEILVKKELNFNMR